MPTPFPYRKKCGHASKATIPQSVSGVDQGPILLTWINFNPSMDK